MKKLFVVTPVLFLLSCGQFDKKNRCSLRVMDSSWSLLMEDRNAQLLRSDLKNTIYVKVSDEKLLESVTKSKIGESVYVEFNKTITNKLTILEPIRSGIVQIDSNANVERIFGNQKDAVENLYKFD